LLQSNFIVISTIIVNKTDDTIIRKIAKYKPLGCRPTNIHLPLTVGLRPSHAWRGRPLSEVR